MACDTAVIESTGFEGAGFYARARVTFPATAGAAATPVTQARASALAWKSYDEAGVLIDSATPSVASCVFDTLQSWDEDAEGFNVSILIPGTASPKGNKTYRIECTLTHDSGVLSDWIVWRSTKGLLSR